MCFNKALNSEMISWFALIIFADTFSYFTIEFKERIFVIKNDIELYKTKKKNNPSEWIDRVVLTYFLSIDYIHIRKKKN